MSWQCSSKSWVWRFKLNQPKFGFNFEISVNFKRPVISQVAAHVWGAERGGYGSCKANSLQLNWLPVCICISIFWFRPFQVFGIQLTNAFISFYLRFPLSNDSSSVLNSTTRKIDLKALSLPTKAMHIHMTVSWCSWLIFDMMIMRIIEHEQQGRLEQRRGGVGVPTLMYWPRPATSTCSL